jgi:hypothetical protein
MDIMVNIKKAYENSEQILDSVPTVYPENESVIFVWGVFNLFCQLVPSTSETTFMKLSQPFPTMFQTNTEQKFFVFIDC